MAEFDLDGLANAAQLYFTDEEKAKLAKSLGEMLDFVREATRANLLEAAPRCDGLKLEACGAARPFREDKANQTDFSESLLANAPKQKDGYIMVPNVFEK